MAYVNANFFDVIGTAPLAGRAFRAGEESAHVVVLTEGVWRTRFGAAADIVGRAIVLDGEPVEVVGVMPASFTLPSTNTDAWMIWTFSPDERTRYGSHYASVFGRLKPGVTLEAARADLAGVARQLEVEHPDSNKDWTTLVFPLQEYAIRNVRTGLIVLVAAVGGLLLIACANVANLLLARGLGRAREFALRAALGAGRARLVRQMLVENLAIGLAGAILGVGLGWWLLKGMLALAPALLPRASTIALDGATLAIALALAVLTPLLFGILPAWQLSRADLNTLVQSGGRSGAATLPVRTRAALIIAEVTLSVVLVAASILLIRSFDRLINVSPGFAPANAVAMSLALPMPQYADDARKAQFYGDLVGRVSALPGVEAAGVVQAVPMVSDYVTSIEVDAPAPDGTVPPSTNFFAVSPGYLRAMGIPLLRGRDFTAADAAGAARVSIISKAVADRFFPNADPIGHKVRVSQGPSRDFGEIIGVVGDVKPYGLARETPLQVYEPVRQHAYFGSLTLITRTGMSSDATAAGVRGVLKDLDPNLPVANVTTLQTIVDNSVGPRRFTTTLLGLFAATALVLAAIGVYGLVSFTVAQRSKEIGIRLALGARGRTIVGQVLAQGVTLTGAGVLLGGLLSYWATSLLASELFEVSARDPLAFTVAPVVLLAAAVLACLVPMRRALKVNPVAALRQ
jgi:putative ABC transport system permease protein